MIKMMFLTLLTLAFVCGKLCGNLYGKQGSTGQIVTFDPSDPSLKLSLWGQKCKIDPYKIVLEGSKNRGQKGVYIYPFLTTPDFEPHPLRASRNTMNTLAHESEVAICNSSARCFPRPQRTR